MSLILDTNALIWLIRGDPALGPLSRTRLEGEPRLCVSDISVFELSIKAAKRKLNVPFGLAAQIDQLGITRVRIRDEHLDAMRTLPFHHNDPFDRYLIAQSIVDAMPIVTSDRAFAHYGVQVIDARQ
ncbi:MAG: type II toxin-antitoxin system VapC family toxin [Salinibacterium sp.]|nr:MAG: type II toxin-antitoxin system VapC family toxin [Salinibacterium sp.]